MEEGGDMGIYVYVYNIFFTHSSADGHLGFFHILAIVNSAAMNIEVLISLEILISIILHKCQEVRLLDHMIVLFLSFEGPPYCF